MHLIFEHSKGRFKSNCNVLAMAWMPYYHESQFKEALLEYYQRQLQNLANQVNRRRRPAEESADAAESGSSAPIGSLARQHRAIRQQASAHRNEQQQQAEQSSRSDGNNQDNLDQEDPSNETLFLNARIAELHQRYLFMNDSQPSGLINTIESTSKLTGFSLGKELDQKYGREADFGWLVVGNVNRIIGITLTSTRAPPKFKAKYNGQPRKSKLWTNGDDLIQIDDPNDEVQATNEVKSIDESVDDKTRPDRVSARTNYNLRGHMDEIIIVKWNELYQKLATVDSKGNVLFWVKVNDRFTIQTPFYNRTKTVADFKWSNDGRTALICYTDSFILVGSSTANKSWHSMLNLEDYHITCASWTPNDEQLLLGVSNGNIVVIDLATSFLTELTINHINIRTMCWSTCDINLRNLNELSSGVDDCNKRPQKANQDNRSCRTNSRIPIRTTDSTTSIVNHRRLSRDCSLFCNYKFFPHGPRDLLATGNNLAIISSNARSHSVPNDNGQESIGNSNNSTTTKPQLELGANLDRNSSKVKNILALDFANSTIRLYDGGLDDPRPKCIQVNLESYIMQWSSDGKILAVAGFNIHTSAPSIGHLRCRYSNLIKFYNQQGKLIYEHLLNFKKYPITAFAWAHDDKRIFVATGTKVHCAKVFHQVGPLSLLALSCLQRRSQLPSKLEAMENILKGHFGKTGYTWQSFNCPVDILKNFQNTPEENTTSDLKQLVGIDNNSQDETSCPTYSYNSNLFKYILPANLRSKMDDLFSQTIRQPFEDSWTLSDIIWHVPRDERRYYCTLICYTCEQEIGSYYPSRVEQLSHSTASNEASSDQYKIFVLYIEFQGSLIPILRARRIGLLKPEFAIFDPEDYSVKLTKHSKVTDVLSSTIDSGKFMDGIAGIMMAPPYIRDTSHLYQYSAQSGSSAASYIEPNYLDNSYSEPRTSGASLGKQSLSDADQYYNFECDTDNRKIQSKFSELMANRSNHQEPIPSAPMQSFDRNLSKSNDFTIQKMKNGQLTKSQVRYLLASTSTSGYSNNGDLFKQLIAIKLDSSDCLPARSLPENKELARIKSNIWGTKFKIINKPNRVMRQYAILGSVSYKASILHLQPRQVILSMRNMTNYCCLCSKHHHDRNANLSTMYPSAKQQTRRSISKFKHRSNQELNLIDMPICKPSSSQMSPNKRTDGDPSDTVFLPVGCSLKVAPKLEQNQRFKFANKTRNDRMMNSPNSSKTPSKSHRKRRSKHNKGTSSETHRANSSFLDTNPIIFNSSTTIKQTSRRSKSRAETDEGDDDILTLSMGQNDRLEVEMSTPSTSMSREQEQVDAFVASNKTLKSIQTITKMIVDLSSKAENFDDDDDDNSQSELSEEGATKIKAEDSPESPSKLIKLFDELQSGSSPVNASKFVPPETPVHRPNYHRAPKPRNQLEDKLRKTGQNSAKFRQAQTQSANATPLRGSSARLSKSHGPETSLKSSNEIQNHPLPQPPAPASLSRKLSSSAKRLFDGSLRSLSNLGSGAFSAANSDVETEDYEPLVSRRSGRRMQRQPAIRSERPSRNSCQSQPCSPMRSLKEIYCKRGENLETFSSQLMQKLFTAKKNNGEQLEISGSGLGGFKTLNTFTTASRKYRRAETREGIGKSGEFVSSAEDLSDLSFDSDLDMASASSSDETNGQSGSLSQQGAKRKPLSRAATSASQRKHFYSLTPSKELVSGQRNGNCGGCKRAAAETTPKCRCKFIDCNHTATAKLTGNNSTGGCCGSCEKRRAKLLRARRANEGKSICLNCDCCCRREFKLNNRPPVWNEQSQVYQLDFGGRVTQESTKNLQIDFEGNLALQFGRLDRCTYTLDYRYPFNAVQAMAVALASLTQRLK